MNNPKDYTNHSGGAKGADLEWDRIGREFGVENHIHYTPNDLKHMHPNREQRMLDDVKSAAKALGRPHYFKGVELVQRNWFQAEDSQAIFAIGYIIDVGEKDFKGFVNNTGKPILSGGTAWAVEMAIQMGKPVYVFDQRDNIWTDWFCGTFAIHSTPILTKKFAGIGSRQLTPFGEQAIRDVYTKTFQP